MTPLLGDAFFTCKEQGRGKAGRLINTSHASSVFAHGRMPNAVTTQRYRLCTHAQPRKRSQPSRTSAISPGLPVRAVAALIAPIKSRGAGLPLAATTSEPSDTFSLQAAARTKGEVSRQQFQRRRTHMQLDGHMGGGNIQVACS